MQPSGLLDVLATTLRVASCAVLIAAPCGIALGWWLSRSVFPGKSVVETLLALPLVLPPVAVGYLLLALFARDGWLGERMLGFDPGILFTWKGAVLASAAMALPLVARTARTTFDGVDPRLELMARTAGMSPWRVRAFVTLPLARRGLAAACVLGFGRALGEFGATVVVAGNIPGRTQTIALAIFGEIQQGRTTAALRLVALVAALAFALLWSVERLQGAAGRDSR
jgi:molybdate transport system permease protein